MLNSIRTRAETRRKAGEIYGAVVTQARSEHFYAALGVPDTPTGRYRVFRKELMSWSVPFSTWLPFASYFNNGIAFHEYPDVPPYPASHGCVRVPTPDSKRVYEFARMNTVVVVRS